MAQAALVSQNIYLLYKVLNLVKNIVCTREKLPSSSSVSASSSIGSGSVLPRGARFVYCWPIVLSCKLKFEYMYNLLHIYL